MDNQHTFLKRRQEFEESYFNDLQDNDVLRSISVIDVSTIDLCNRACVFCPRHDPKVYPNRNLRMTGDGAEIIARKLEYIDYRGTIAISGFGENLLNPDILEIIVAFKSRLPNAFVELNTNGDPLTTELVYELLDTGLDCLNINLYDGPEQVEKFDEMLSFIPRPFYKYRVHWGDDHGIIFNNRSGMIQWVDESEEVEKLKNTPCYYPFYKMFVDWNGDVLFCANDWGRTRIVGNLLQQSVRDVWMSKEMEKVRKRLMKPSREFKPCDTCNVKGTLVGEKSFNLIKDYYANSRNRID